MRRNIYLQITHTYNIDSYPTSSYRLNFHVRTVARFLSGLKRLKIFYGAPTVTPIDMTCPKFHILLRNIKYADLSLELKTTLA